MPRARSLVVAAALSAFAGSVSFGCGDSVAVPTGLKEPIRFGYTIDGVSQSAQFFKGEIPTGNGPAIAGIDIDLNEVVEGQLKKKNIGVRAKQPALTIAARFRNGGSGYWVSRVGLVEVFAAGEVRSDLFFDISPDVLPGNYEIELVGIDGNQHFGPPVYMPLLVKPRVPADSAAVIALRWDRAIDFDLQVRAPSGVFLNPKYPTTAAPASGTTAVDPDAPGVGKLDRDSLAQCVDDGLRQENVVFATAPSPGNYTIYANVFDSCKQLGATYEVTVYVGGAVTKRFYGTTTASQQLGGYQLGDLVGDVTF